MSRCFSQPKAIAYDDVWMSEHTPRGQTIHVPETTSRNTGLLDETGEPIYATNSIPCGFKR